MKRKPEDARDPSGFKMPRRGVDNSLNDCGEVRPWEQRPGMILEVKMRNFMCHQVFQEVNDRDSEQELKGHSSVLHRLIFVSNLKGTVWILIVVMLPTSYLCEANA